jgi:serine/threonine-protein kinase RsbW
VQAAWVRYHRRRARETGFPTVNRSELTSRASPRILAEHRRSVPELTRPADLELTLPARAESVTVARQALSGIADAMGWDGTFLADLKIAVSEACSNVVMHAYEDGDGPLELTGWVEGDAVTFVVTDRGSGISPRLQTGAAGLGLGLPLMAALSDEVEVRSPPGGPTEVRMTFRIRAPEQM